ncbi:hypothetical protein [Gynuella sp.]|uniref:hypothetical protein n=1 Tax=Gynuella sp. TaxID=2969146 RepID=UPI003D13BCED
MFSPIISILFGVMSFLMSVPVVLPVFGLALGANGLIKQLKLSADAQTKWIKNASIVGIVICSISVISFFLLRT